MKRGVLIAVVAVFVALAAYYAYTRDSVADHMRQGDVTSDDVRENDGNAAHATPSPSDTAGTVNAQPVRPVQADSQNASMAALQTPPAAVNSPGTDSQPPNAPNGVAFAGSGRFQVYRQGNLTWRVNTDNGSTCILFATNEEWRKPVVYNHGCGNS